MAPHLKGLAKGQRAFASWDEDAVTLAVEAARDCLAGANARPSILQVASTSFPFADLQHSSLVASALGLPQTIASTDIGFSQRAGTSGLLSALLGKRDALFIASDAPVARPASAQELSFGAGAAAFLLGSDEVIAHLVGAASITTPFVDHFRAAQSKYDYNWEERWVRDEGYAKIAPAAIKAALEDADLNIDDVDHFVMPSMQRGAAEMVAKRIGVKPGITAGLETTVGYAGTAHALLLLAGALEVAEPGQVILCVGFGQGADALVLRVTDAIESCRPQRGLQRAVADGLVTDSYLRMLSFQEGIDLEWGMRAEKNAKAALTEQYRSKQQIDSMTAGRCRSCGTVQFPQLTYCVKPGCNAPAMQFEQVSLVDEPASVITYTADWLSYHPAPPLYVGFVQFDLGARLLMEIVDVGSGGIEVGAKVRMTYRIKERDRVRGYNRYFWKATPITGADA
jgi:3-hydroxy-3-methylglutaryl CoA synthase